ncbi:MAG: hypothetical protein KDB27_11490 [Planctomycetales bacterium]|nr:hypothetical protein [Planctomycetales bacterium]
MSSTRDASSNSLGKRVATYFPESRKYRKLLWLLSATTAVGAWSLYHALLQPDASRLFLGSSIVVLAAAALSTIRLWVRQTRQVHLHQFGVEYIDIVSSDVFHWEDICNVWQTPVYSDKPNNHKPQGWTVRIESNDERRLKLDRFEGSVAIARRIQNEITHRMLGSYQHAYEAGHWLRFGKKLSVSREGIKVGSKGISWYEINDVFLDEEDGVRIGYSHESTHWLHLPIRTIANFHLLSHLLAWVRSQHSIGIDEFERTVNEDRAIGLFDDKPSECDVSELSACGFEWDEIDDVISGECSVNELLERGPRQRPRVPK